MPFPSDFVWGAATAAYQVEGAVTAGGRGPSIWDTFSHTPGATWHGDTGDVAIDHFHRYPEDLDLLADLGVRAYRFSVAWPRIQPTGRGRVEPRGLEHYRRMVGAMRDRGIAPIVTLYHWDLPQALQDDGGWAERETTERFAEYAGHVAEALGDQVALWITLNEPWVSCWLGHALGLHAPGLRDPAVALAAAHHQLLGHGLATSALRAALPAGAQVGVTLSLSPTRPLTDKPEDREAADRVDGNLNRLFLDPLLRGRLPADVVAAYRGVCDFAFVRDDDLETIAAPIDVLGVNFYFRTHVTSDLDAPAAMAGLRWPELGAAAVVPPGLPTTTTGWPVEPDALTELLLRLHHEYGAPPIMITEGGCAAEDYVDPDGRVEDHERVAYLRDHLAAALEAVEQGVDLRGYLVWSAFDNFEWAYGYAKRFGLVFVDLGTQRRIPKRSFDWMQRVIVEHGAPVERALEEARASLVAAD